jgi:hypothetical protein
LSSNWTKTLYAVPIYPIRVMFHPSQPPSFDQSDANKNQIRFSVMESGSRFALLRPSQTVLLDWLPRFHVGGDDTDEWVATSVYDDTLTYLVTYLLTYLLTHSLTHSLTPWCRILIEKLIASQPIKNILSSWNPTVYHRVQESSPMDPMLSQLNPRRPIDLYLFKVQLNLILPPTPRSSLWSPILGPANQNTVNTSPLLHAYHMSRPPHPPWFKHPSFVRWSIQAMKFIIKQFSPRSVFLILGTNILNTWYTAHENSHKWHVTTGNEYNSVAVTTAKQWHRCSFNHSTPHISATSSVCF